MNVYTKTLFVFLAGANIQTFLFLATIIENLYQVFFKKISIICFLTLYRINFYRDLIKVYLLHHIAQEILFNLGILHS